MPAILGPRCAAVKKLVQAAKEAALDQAANVALYPDSGVSKATTIIRIVVDPAGVAAPTLRTLCSIAKVIGLP